MSGSPYISLPRDQYGHADADAEWWWHIGTLTAGNRTFGFEIAANARRDNQPEPYRFTELMVTDVQGQAHYQKTTAVLGDDPNWCTYDQTQPWRVVQGEPGGDGSVEMTGPAQNTGQMHVAASFNDAATGTAVAFDLSFAQDGPPLLVFGDGRHQIPTNPPGYNYYYSFTRLAASGTITIAGESFDVTGTTWMDHEYGVFPPATAWLLQDAQLDNGYSLSTFHTLKDGEVVLPGQPITSQTTLLTPDGESIFTDSTMTPRRPYRWTGPGGISVTYFQQYDVRIPSIEAALTFKSLYDDQVFVTESIPIFEGIASAHGTVKGVQVTGTGWIEQDIPPPKS